MSGACGFVRVAAAEKIGRHLWRLTLECGHATERHAVRAPKTSHCGPVTRRPEPKKPPSTRQRDDAHARYMRVLELVAKLGSQTAAARELGVSDQSISDQIIRGRRRAQAMSGAQ